MGYARIATCCCNPYPLYGNSMLSITPYHVDLSQPFFPLSFIIGSMPENTGAYPYFQTLPYSKFLPHWLILLWNIFLKLLLWPSATMEIPLHGICNVSFPSSNKSGIIGRNFRYIPVLFFYFKVRVPFLWYIWLPSFFHSYVFLQDRAIALIKSQAFWWPLKIRMVFW